jgi:hypothetical protein
MTALSVTPNSEIRASVLRLFEEARQDKAGPFEAGRFLAFLTHPPATNGRRVSDTFAGRRRFVRFMESVQLEFGVCFTNEDWESGFTLDRFVERIVAKMAKPHLARRLAEERLAEAQAALVRTPTKFGFLTLPLLVFAVAGNHLSIRILSMLLWIAIVGGVILLTSKSYLSAESLLARANANVAS